MHFRPPTFEPTIYVRSSQDPYVLAGERRHPSTFCPKILPATLRSACLTAPMAALLRLWALRHHSAADLTGCTYNFDYKPPKAKIDRRDVLIVRDDSRASFCSSLLKRPLHLVRRRAVPRGAVAPRALTPRDLPLSRPPRRDGSPLRFCSCRLSALRAFASAIRPRRRWTMHIC